MPNTDLAKQHKYCIQYFYGKHVICKKETHMPIIEQLYQAYQVSHAVTTDSRAITPGCIFFAFKGNKGAKLFNFDWWQFEAEEQK